MVYTRAPCLMPSYISLSPLVDAIAALNASGSLPEQLAKLPPEQLAKLPPELLAAAAAAVAANAPQASSSRQGRVVSWHFDIIHMVMFGGSFARLTPEVTIRIVSWP